MSIVYISIAMTRTESGISMTNEVIARDRDALIEIDRRNVAGCPLPSHSFPKMAWPSDRAEELGYRQLPNLFHGGGFWFASAKACAVLRQFDLGAGALYPVKVLAKDRETPLGEAGWHCINFGNTKTAFLPEQSTRSRPSSGGGWRNISTLKDGEFAVSSSALDGPDMWVNSQLRRGIFFSERLGKALKKAKADHGWLLRTCRVID